MRATDIGIGSRVTLAGTSSPVYDVWSKADKPGTWWLCRRKADGTTETRREHSRNLDRAARVTR